MTDDTYCYEVKNLPKCDIGGKCDLYCVLNLPNGTKPYPRTKIYDRNYDPVLNETLYETGTKGDVTIHLYDKDKCSDDYIGFVTIKSEELPVYRKEYIVNLAKGMTPRRSGDTTLTVSAGRIYDCESMKRHLPDAMFNIDSTVNPEARELFVPFGEFTFVGFRYEKILSCESKEHAQPAEGVSFCICQAKTANDDKTNCLTCPGFDFKTTKEVAFSYFLSSSPVLSGKAPVLRRVAKKPIYLEIRAPNFTFTPLDALTINTSTISKFFTQRVSQLFKLHGVTDDTFAVLPDAYKDAPISISPTVSEEDGVVTCGVSPLYSLTIKRDSPANVELWVDDLARKKYYVDISYLSSSTDRKIRCRLMPKTFANVTSHYRIGFSENIPRMLSDKLEITVGKTESKTSISLFELFPCMKSQ